MQRRSSNRSPSRSTDRPGIRWRVAVDGRFWQGVQHGRHTSPTPSTSARPPARAAGEPRRSPRLDAVDGDPSDARRSTGPAAERGQRAARLRSTAAAKALAAHRVDPHTRCKTVTESAGALRRPAPRRRRRPSANSTRPSPTWRAKEKQLRATASTHRTPHVGPGPRFARRGDPALREAGRPGAALQARTRQGGRAQSRIRRPARTRPRRNAEEFAEEAAIAEESLAQQVQRLDTLRDTLGASAEQIDRQTSSEARARIEACKVEQRAARKADEAAGRGHRQGRGRVQHRRARPSGMPLTETRADADRLAPYARRDLLELLGVGGSHYVAGQRRGVDERRSAGVPHPDDADDAPDAVPPEVGRTVPRTGRRDRIGAGQRRRPQVDAHRADHGARRTSTPNSRPRARTTGCSGTRRTA